MAHITNETNTEYNMVEARRLQAKNAGVQAAQLIQLMRNLSLR
jgi:hypothetical protein